MAVVGKTLFWARLRKDVGTRAALEWWLGSAATEEQIANWKKAHRALMPAHLIVQRLQSGEYEAVGWEVENGGDSAVRRACWYMAGMLPYTADWGESWELYCQKWQDHAHDVLRLLTFPGDMLHLTAQAEIGQPRRVRDLYYMGKIRRGRWEHAEDAGRLLIVGPLTEGQAGQLWKEEDCEYQPISAEEAAQYHWCPYRGTNLKTCDNACGKLHKCE